MQAIGVLLVYLNAAGVVASTVVRHSAS